MAFMALMGPGALGELGYRVESGEGAPLEEVRRDLHIVDWSFFAASRVAIIHHVTIENSSGWEYRDVRVKVYYYSTSYQDYGRLVSSTSGVLHITVPPHSKATYLAGGATLGAGSMSYRAKNIKIVGAARAGSDN